MEILKNNCNISTPGSKYIIFHVSNCENLRGVDYQVIKYWNSVKLSLSRLMKNDRKIKENKQDKIFVSDPSY